MAKIDHIGIAVNSLRESVPLFRALLDEKPAGEEQVPGEGVRVAFFGEGAGRIELLEPSDPGSPVARFLARHGPGIHHVCLVVEDVQAALERASAHGADPIPPDIREGAGGSRVAFLHPRSTGGVLIELTERADAAS